MEEELKQLKSVLRSLVVSSATQVDVRMLLRDYRTMVGKHLPYAKYGYKEPIPFLKEHFSDCFLFQGPAINPVLMLIVPDSLKHVDKFVQKQRVIKGKLKGKRRSVNEKTMKPVCNESNLIVKTFATRDTTIKGAPLFNKVKVDLQNDKENVDTQSLLEPPSSIKEDKDNNYTIKENGICSQKALQNFLKKRTPVYTSLSVSDKESTREDSDSGRLTSSSTSSKRIQIEQLHREIKEIIMEDPNGVWCTDLLRLYRARHNRELNYSRLGYTSVLSVVSALDGVHVIRRGLADDWLLSDAARPPPTQPSPHRAPRAVRRPPTAPVDADDALPGIDFEPDVFPADCVHFLESIPGVSLADVSPGDMLEVAVAEVYSPSHFWLLRLGEEYDIATENMMDDMNEYYERGEGRDRRLAPGAVRAGHYCASLYDGDWHRSIIVRTLDADAVKVRHVDYGTVESVAVASLRPLLRRFAALPAQAVRARLAAARPPAAGRRWPHAASHHFLLLVRDRRLVANVVAMHAGDRALEVLLIDTTTADDRCVATELVRTGHADPRPAAAALDTVSILSCELGVDDDEDDDDEEDARVRPLLEEILRFDRRTRPALSPACLFDDDDSDASLSASQVAGRGARDLRPWSCGSDAESESAASVASSCAMARLTALRARLQLANEGPRPARDGPRASHEGARLLQDGLRAVHEGARLPQDGPHATDENPGPTQNGSLPAKAGSRPLQRRLAIARLIRD